MQNEFILSINPDKFKYTNQTWNNLTLNSRWSVGYVTTLIEAKPFIQKEEWEAFYYDSGKEREDLISRLDKQVQKELNQISEISNHKHAHLNLQYGRTEDRLREKAEKLFNAVKNNGHHLTLEDCFECVRFRVICETWNGVIVREKQTIETLKREFPSLNFQKVTGEVDYEFAVDYEIYNNQKLLCAIQIKPESYKWNTPYIEKARRANQIKNESYSQKYKVAVYYIYSKNNGEVINREILQELKKLK